MIKYRQNFLPIIFIFFILNLVIFSSGCNPEPIKKMGTAISIEGQSLCDESIDFYNQMNDLNSNLQENDKNLYMFLDDPNKIFSLYLDKEKDKKEFFTKNIEIRIEVYQNFKEVFKSLGILCDGKYPDNFSTSASALIDSLKGINAVAPFIEDNQKTIAGIINPLSWLIEHKQINDIKEHSEKIQELLEGLQHLWSLDKKYWIQALDRSAESNTNRLSGIIQDPNSIKNFDLDALRNNITEPVSKEKLPCFYIMHLCDDYNLYVKNRKLQMEKIETGFSLLKDSLEKLKKYEGSSEDVFYILEKIQIILDDINKIKEGNKERK